MIRSVLLSSAVVVFGMASTGLEKPKLQFKHNEGSTSTVEANSKIHQILSIAGMDVETAVDSKATVTSSVGKRGSDGRLPIRQKVDALQVQLSLPGGVAISFDSNSPNVTNDNPMIQAMLDTFKARIGSGHSIVLDKDDKVIAIEGADQILEKATPAAALILLREVNVDQMKKAAEQSFAILPNEPVGEGDSWTRTAENRIGGGQTLTFETKYEYLGTVEKDGKKLDKIGTTALTVTYAMDANAASPLKVTQSALKIESSKGTILFDREKGQAVQSSSVTRIVGDMTFTVNGMELPSKLDLTFDSSNVLQK